MKRLKIPQSEEDTDLLIFSTKELLKGLPEDGLEREYVLKDLAVLAGSFNRYIKYKHRDAIMNILVDYYDDAKRSVIEAVVDYPREEYYDLAITFFERALRHENGNL